jgi:hypothetical protein
MTKDPIDRAALLDFMERVYRHMQDDMLAAGNAAYLRGYQAAITDIKNAPAMGKA